MKINVSGWWPLLTLLYPYVHLIQPWKTSFRFWLLWSCTTVIHSTSVEAIVFSLLVYYFQKLGNWEVLYLPLKRVSNNHTAHSFLFSICQMNSNVQVLRLWWKKIGKDLGACIQNPLLATKAEQILVSVAFLNSNSRLISSAFWK